MTTGQKSTKAGPAAVAPSNLRFIDVFAGCGGLSLGLVEAGLQGVFAVEKSPLAFETLKHNLVNGIHHQFAWPQWLPVEPTTCEELLDTYSEQLAALRGTIDLMVGGPPCQGFSIAGRRDPADPRNKMTEQYLRLVDILQPRYIVIENVAGFDFPFASELAEAEQAGTVDPDHATYAQYIAHTLQASGYDVSNGLLDCSDFGVPQHRMRYLIMCVRREDGRETTNLFELLRERRTAFLERKGLPIDRSVQVREALADLEIQGKTLVSNVDSGMAGFEEIDYREPSVLTPYQTLMRARSRGEAPNSLRLPRHREATVARFRLIQSVCRAGHSLTAKQRAALKMNKQSVSVLSPLKPSLTVTTLPDDILHYSEPRILTARENARLQSFPDWFAFQGKYTTGGKMRKLECPRYTQIGNAVPPLLSEAIGDVVRVHAARPRVPETAVAFESTPTTRTDGAVILYVVTVTSHVVPSPCLLSSGPLLYGAARWPSCKLTQATVHHVPIAHSSHALPQQGGPEIRLAVFEDDRPPADLLNALLSVEAMP